MPTSFLTARSSDAVRQLHDLRQQKEIVKSVDAFKQRRDELATEQKAFAELMRKGRLLRSHGLDVEIPKLVWFLQGEFSKVQTNFEATPDSLTQSNLKTVFNQSTKCREELSVALLEAWQGYVEAMRLKLDAAILSVLSGVPNFRNAVASLQELDTRIEIHRGRVPRSDEDFDALQHDVEKMKRIWDELGGEGLPKEVLDFLRIAGNRSVGSPLELLDKIRPWLIERELEVSFRVVIKG